MQIQPANLEQVRRGRDGRIIVISADSAGVADALRRHDPCLRLKWAEHGSPPYYVVYRLHRGGLPCADDDPERTEELVLTAQECDHRITERVMQIDSRGRGGYDYAAEVEKQNLAAEKAKRDRARTAIEEHGEQLAHAIRKDLGWRYNGRATPHRFGRTNVK